MWNQSLKQLRIVTFSNLSQRNPSFLSFLIFLVPSFPSERWHHMTTAEWCKTCCSLWNIEETFDILCAHFLCFLSVPRRLWIRITCFHRMKAATSSHQLYRRPTSTPPHITRLLWANTTSPPWIHPAATCTADARTHISCFLRAVWPGLRTLIRPCRCTGKCMDPQEGWAHNLQRCRKMQWSDVRIRWAHVVFL